MNTPDKKPGLLERIRQNDSDAIELTLELAKTNALLPSQLQAVLYIVAIRADTGGDQAKKLAQRIASPQIMPYEVVKKVTESLVSNLKDPDGASVEGLRAVSEAAILLIEQGRIKESAYIDIVDAVAEGLTKTTDKAKRMILKDWVGEYIINKLPDVQAQIYEAVLETAVLPAGTMNCVVNERLQAYLNRDKTGKIILESKVKERIETVLRTQNPHIGSSPPLPLPQMATNPTPSMQPVAIQFPKPVSRGAGMVSIISGIGKRPNSRP